MKINLPKIIFMLTLWMILFSSMDVTLVSSEYKGTSLENINPQEHCLDVSPKKYEPDIVSNFSISSFPNNYNTVFSITDDTDHQRLCMLKPFYEELCEMGIYGTKTVWMVNTTANEVYTYLPPEVVDKYEYWVNYADYIDGNEEYTDWCKDLEKKGWYITLHTAGGNSDNVTTTEYAINRFRNIFGHTPAIWIDHSTNLEDIDHFGVNATCKEFFIADKLEKYGIKYWRKNYLSEKVLWKTEKNKSIGYGGNNSYLSSMYCFPSIKGNNITAFLNSFSDEKIEYYIANRIPMIVGIHSAKGFVDYYDKFNQTWKNAPAWYSPYWVENHGFSNEYTYKINASFKEKLQTILSKDVWCIDTYTLLERARYITENLSLKENRDVIELTNNGEECISNLTLLSNGTVLLQDEKGNLYLPNNEGEISVGNIPPGSYFYKKLNINTHFVKTYPEIQYLFQNLASIFILMSVLILIGKKR